MAKFFFTSGRIRPGLKRKDEYGVNPIRPQYSEMGGGNGGSNNAYASGGSADGGTGFFGAQDQHPKSGASSQPKSSTGGYYQPKGGETGESGNAAAANGYDAGSFEDYYSRLISALHSYGIDMALPTLDELYNQLTSFLRPSVDAAIEGRQKYGEPVMAELDADAYSRGMGSSSYLSSMKNREYDDIANDIAAMESNYNSTLAEYLYNASNELANIQAQFAAMNRQHELEMQRQLQQQAFEAEQERLRRAYEMERLRQQQAFERAMRASAGSGSGSGGGRGSSNGGRGSSNGGRGGSNGGRGGSSGAPNGNDSGGSSGNAEHSGTEADYYNYTVYLNSLSSDDQNNVFNSSSEYWIVIRDELKRNLSHSQYERLRAAFDPRYNRGAGGRNRNNPGMDGIANMFN